MSPEALDDQQDPNPFPSAYGVVNSYTALLAAPKRNPFSTPQPAPATTPTEPAPVPTPSLETYDGVAPKTVDALADALVKTAADAKAKGIDTDGSSVRSRAGTLVRDALKAGAFGAREYADLRFHLAGLFALAPYWEKLLAWLEKEERMANGPVTNTTLDRVATSLRSAVRSIEQSSPGTGPEWSLPMSKTAMRKLCGYKSEKTFKFASKNWKYKEITDQCFKVDLRSVEPEDAERFRREESIPSK